MATGILGQASLAATTNTTVYTVPVSKTGTFNINVVNTNGSPVTVRIAVASTSTPAAAEYFEYETVLVGYGVLERGGLVAQAAENVVAYASTTGVTVSVYGYEE
jgi:hypothetical protein